MLTKSKEVHNGVTICQRRVLVVEDEPGISKICERVLGTEGYDVDVAVNGKIALAMVREKTYDICLLDIRTPDMNGIDFYEHLKKERPELAHKIIFTTGDVFSSSIKEFLDKTGQPCLPKPFTPDQLRAIFRTAFGLNQDRTRQVTRSGANKYQWASLKGR